MRIIKCKHGKTVFEDCDECEAIWLKERISDYKNKIAYRCAKLKEVEKRLDIKRSEEI